MEESREETAGHRTKSRWRCNMDFHAPFTPFLALYTRCRMRCSQPKGFEVALTVGPKVKLISVSSLSNGIERCYTSPLSSLRSSYPLSMTGKKRFSANLRPHPRLTGTVKWGMVSTAIVRRKR